MNPPIFVLDTSFILALLNPDDILHEQTVAQIFAIKANEIRFEIPLICLIESIIKQPEPQSIIAYLKELIDQRDFEVTVKDDAEFIANLPLKTRNTLKANDCIVLAISNRLGAKLFSLDKKLLKAYNSL